MILGVCGGRDYVPSQDEELKLLDFCVLENVSEIVHGGASGADAFASEFARRWRYIETVFSAEWSVYGKKAGPIRNTEIARYLESNGGALWVFPGGRGTNDMVKKAQLSGILTFNA